MNTLRNPSDSRLRIGLLIDSFDLPRWIHRIIEDIQSSSAAEIVLVIKNASAEPARRKKGSVLRKAKDNRNYLLYKLYTRLDERLMKVGEDAFEKQNIQHLIPGCPVIQIEPLMKKYTDSFQDEDIEAIGKYDLDVVLRFGFRILKGRALRIARHGVWGYHHGDALVNRGGPPGFWEVMHGESVTGSVLQILTEELDNGRVIYRSWSPTVNKFSVKKNNNNYYWKSSAFVLRKLKELHEVGDISFERNGCNTPFRPYSNRLYKTPTNAEMLPLLLRLSGRAARRLVEKTFTFEQWCLAYRFSFGATDANDTLYKFKHLIPPKDRFWADPFPIKFEGKYFIFLEELLYKTGRGHISVIELDHEGQPKDVVRVLERPYHLSYPFVFEWQGRHYMIPETSENRTVELYLSTSFPFEWKLEKVLLDDIDNAADATLFEIDGLWWMFVNIGVKGVSANDEELYLFYSDTPLGPWTPHRRNPVKSDVRNSRPAGRPFRRNGFLYRPSQDSSKRYGYAISINKIVRLSLHEFQEEEVSKILPQWEKRIIATHTLNISDELTVVDCLRKSRKFFG